jgi:hypothetical protein
MGKAAEAAWIALFVLVGKKCFARNPVMELLAGGFEPPTFGL